MKKKVKGRMKNTHITFILDRTGSMATIKDETISGFNVFLTEQQKLSGLATMSLVQFDSQDSFEILSDFVNIKEVKPLNDDIYAPRGATPLLDAIKQGIEYTAKKLAKTPSWLAPEIVIVAILTDGYENASHIVKNKSEIKRMIEEKQGDGWKFIFLGANMDAIDEAASFGISSGTSMTYASTSSGIVNTYYATNSMVTNFREGNVNYAYSDSDRNKALEDE